MTLADNTKLSFAFLNNGLVSTLENTKVRDAAIAKHDSAAATRKLQQVPECKAARARTGQSWSPGFPKSTFPMAQCSHIHGKAQKKKKKILSTGYDDVHIPRSSIAWLCQGRRYGLFWPTALDGWSVANCAVDHIILRRRNTLRIKREKQRISQFELRKQNYKAVVNLFSHRNPLLFAVLIWFLYLTMVILLILCFTGVIVWTEIMSILLFALFLSIPK